LPSSFYGVSTIRAASSASCHTVATSGEGHRAGADAQGATADHLSDRGQLGQDVAYELQQRASDSEPTMPGSRDKGGETMRAEEGDETIDELADEAAKAKKELRESTETGEKVQKQEKAADK
jgi:hypothetical protein